jgi:predicted O-methyltransferase YrrM
MINPKYILEIGTYTGYSALCLAEGLVGDGKLITIDNNEELEDLVKEHVSMSPKASQIEVRTGNALDIIETYNYAWDMVFIDADKENYLNYYKQIIDKIKPGGFILADNVLWSGKVVDPKSLSKDIDTQKIHEFNEYIANDSRVEHVLLPIRDGIMVVRKK